MKSPDEPHGIPPPSLFGDVTDSVPPGQQQDELRMLSGLDGRTSPSRGDRSGTRRGLQAALAGAVVIIGAAGWWQLTRSSMPVEAAPSPTSTEVAGPVSPVVAQGPEKATATGSTDAASAPAVIESMIAPSAVNATENARVKSVERAASTVPTASNETEPAPVKTMASAVGPRATPAQAATHHLAPVAPATPRVAATKTRTGGSASGGDSDVELLTAMVTHLEGGDGPALPAPAERSGTSGKAMLQVGTVEKLARSCRQFGDKEQARCQRQVCDGYWGKTNACPVRLAPSKRVAAER